MTLKQQIELLQAIDSGQTVQRRNQHNLLCWDDIAINNEGGMVNFRDGVDYRIKPREPRKVWLQIYTGIFRASSNDVEKPDGPGWTQFVEVLP